MSTIILTVMVIILLTLSSGIIVWSVFYVRRLAQGKETAAKVRKETRLPFHWSYIVLLVGTFFLTIIIAALFCLNCLLR